jgi:ATP-binding cassette subfamily B multidrug efflux pump
MVCDTIGSTGAGKTTLINLLMRFYDPQEGEILIDGKRLLDITRDSLRRSFAMVLQDTWLFQGTIRDNIAYGKPDATLEEIEQAAKAAHIASYIESLPNGYDSIISDSASNLSQGQKQLMTIARAMLLDTPMLILDEATSNVDSQTEIMIQDAMNKLVQGRTSFVIAHRLSTVRNADQILLLSDGQIVEQGTHEELLEKGEVYADLYQAQFS